MACKESRDAAQALTAFFFVSGGEALYQLENLPAQFQIGNPRIGGDKLRRFGACKVRRRRRCVLRETIRPSRRLLRQPFIKVWQADTEDARNLEQSARADAVGAAFVLLNLLESDSQHFTKSFLTKPQQIASRADAPSHMRVYSIRLFFRHRCSANSYSA